VNAVATSGFIGWGSDMQKIRVTFRCEVSENATDKEIEEWIKFQLHATGGMSLKSCLCDDEIEARNVEIDYL
jgi:hypothetical protein